MKANGGIFGDGIFSNQAQHGCQSAMGGGKRATVAPIVGLLVSGLLVALVMALDTPAVRPPFPALKP